MALIHVALTHGSSISRGSPVVGTDTESVQPLHAGTPRPLLVDFAADTSFGKTLPKQVASWLQETYGMSGRTAQQQRLRQKAPQRSSHEEKWPSLTQQTTARRTAFKRLDALSKPRKFQLQRRLTSSSRLPWTWQPRKKGCKQLVRAGRGSWWELEWDSPPLSPDVSRETLPKLIDALPEGSPLLAPIVLPELPQPNFSANVYNRRRAGPAFQLNSPPLPKTKSYPSQAVGEEKLQANGDPHGTEVAFHPVPPAQARSIYSKRRRPSGRLAALEKRKKRDAGKAAALGGSKSLVSLATTDGNSTGRAWHSDHIKESEALKRCTSQPVFGSDGRRAGMPGKPTKNALRRFERSKLMAEAAAAANKSIEETTVTVGDRVMSVRKSIKQQTVVVISGSGESSDDDFAASAASEKEGSASPLQQMRTSRVSLVPMARPWAGQERPSCKELAARFGPSGHRRSTQFRNISNERHEWLCELQQQLRAGLSYCDSLDECTTTASGIIDAFQISQAGSQKIAGVIPRKGGSDQQVQEVRQKEIRRRCRELQSEASSQSLLTLRAPVRKTRQNSTSSEVEDGVDRGEHRRVGGAFGTTINSADMTPASSLGLGEENGEQFSDEDRLWIETFHKFKEDNQVHRDDLFKIVERVGLVPDTGWIDEVFEKVSNFSALRIDEFLRFMVDYTHRQRMAFQQAFIVADTDGSGLMDVHELAQLLQSFGIEPLKHVLAEVVAEVAEDETNQINFKGFEAVMMQLRTHEGFATQQFSNFMDVFVRFDRDASGEIDARELAAILKWLGYSIDGNQVKAVITEVDKDGSGKINQREFLVCMRRVQEEEIRHVRRIMQEYDADGSGELDTTELKALFFALGYLPDDEAVQEAMRDAGLEDGDESFDLSELIRILHVYRSREGLSGSETLEVEAKFKAYQDGDSGEMLAADVGKLLLELGFSTSVHAQRSAIATVDPDCGSRLEVIELKKLVRIFRERDLRPVQDMYLQFDETGKESISRSDAVLCLERARCVNEQGEVPRNLVQELLDGEGDNVDFHTLLNVAMHYIKARKQAMSENHGFDWAEVARMRVMFRKYDADDSGDIGNRELMHLIEDAMPSMAHDRALRPKLLDVLRTVDKQGDGAVDFDEFLHLMRLVQEISDRDKVVKESAAVEETGFTPPEVEGFRTLYRSYENGAGALSAEQVRQLLHMLTPIGDKYTEEFRALFYETVKSERGMADFPDFLRLVKRLLDINFANLDTVLNNSPPR